MKRIKSAHIVLIIIAAVQFIATFGIGLLDIEIPIIVNLLLSQLSVILPFAVYCIVKKINPLHVIRFKKIKWHTIILSVFVVLCSYPVIIVLNMISMLFVDNAMMNVIPDVLKLGLPLGLALMAVMPAIFEETIFRGMLYNTYSKRRPIAGIILSALLFGLMHQNFNQMPYAFYLGLILALMLEASDTIIAPMIMHFTLNGISTIISFFTLDSLTMDTSAAVDFKSILRESIEMSLAQSGMAVSEAEITAMFPIFLVVIIAVFVFMALVSLAITAALIYVVFRLNKRHPKEVLLSKNNDALMIKNKNGVLKKNNIFDIWCLIFIIYTIGMCVLDIFI